MSISVSGWGGGFAITTYGWGSWRDVIVHVPLLAAKYLFDSWRDVSVRDKGEPLLRSRGDVAVREVGTPIERDRGYPTVRIKPPDIPIR